jgi:hypothetical protein
MSAPNITVAIEPTDGSAVAYEPVARQNANGKPAGVLCLMLAITNKETKPIHLSKVTLSFAGPPAVPLATIPVPANWWPPDGQGVNIAPGATRTWNFLRESFENDSVVLPDVAPASMTLNLYFDGFSSPWSVTKTLAPHKNPVKGNAYLYPAQSDDLRPREFWVASSNAHGTGSAGSQLFGYDMGVVGWDDTAKAITWILPGTDGTHNEDRRIWDKKIHAMADGVVLQAVNDCPNNPVPIDTQFKKDDDAYNKQVWDDQMNTYWGPYDVAHPGANAGAGNHFYIQHGEEVALYAHMQMGTLNADLLTPGATVTAGKFLGRAGNSGNASGPHLHIHTIKGTQPESGPLRPLLFRDMFAIDQADLNLPNIVAPWARVNVQGPPLGQPNALTFIWPLGRNPEWVGWEDLGGPIFAPPAVASWAANRLDVFSAGSDHKLNHKWWNGSAWHQWETLGGAFKGGPAAVSWGSNRIDVFVRGMDDHLGHLWWNGSAWNGWEDLGGTVTSVPAAASWAANRLDVFAAGSDKNLKHKWWDGSVWHNWQNLGGTFSGAPAAVSWGPNRIDVFVRGMDDHLGHLWWNGSSWNGWEDLGGPITSAPAVASWQSNRLDVFAAGADGNLMHKWWDGSKWSDWDWLGGVFQDNPAAVSWAKDRIDVFVRGMDNKLGHLWKG